VRVFQPGYLSRTAPGVAAKDMTFAAIDLETTGLQPPAHRVCEVAVVRFRGDGTVLEEYATLVDPERRISPGAAECNNIAIEDVKGAPTFAQVWPDLLRMLSGSVIVAHNLLFEDKFLAAELSRLGQPFPPLAGVCSMVTCRAQLDGPAYGLQSVYRTATGQWINGAHTALGDCRALAVLIPWLIAEAPAPLRYYGPQPVTLRSAGDGQPGRIFPRAERLTRHADGYLGALARRFPRTSVEYRVDPGAAQRYDDALDEITADHAVTGDEGRRMEQFARHAGFNQEHLMAAHRAAWDRATRSLPVAEPGRLTRTQRRKLLQLARDLGYPDLAAHLAVDDADNDAPLTQYLRGWRIGIEGDDEAAARLRTLITSNGGSVAKRLTATVRFVAATDPTGKTPQLAQARELGLTVVPLKVGTAQIAKAVKAAETQAKRREREQQRWEADRAREQAKDDAYYRHRWRPVENNPEWGRPEKAVPVKLPRGSR
jgi:DNA polymerase-3 subunit epsilon